MFPILDLVPQDENRTSLTAITQAADRKIYLTVMEIYPDLDMEERGIPHRLSVPLPLTRDHRHITSLRLSTSMAGRRQSAE